MTKVALGIAIFVELIGGVMLVVGFKTGVVAILMACVALATAFVFHPNLADQTEFLFFFRSLEIFGLLQVAALGAGRMSFDRS